MTMLTHFTIVMTGISPSRAWGDVDKDNVTAKFFALSASDLLGDEQDSMVASSVHSNLEWGSFGKLLLFWFGSPSELFDEQIIVTWVAEVAAAVEEVT
jgi:hypothetical protein